MNKLLTILIVTLLVSSCATTKHINELIPSHAYNKERISRKCYQFDVNSPNGTTYRFIVNKDNDDYYWVYHVQPVQRLRRVK